MVQYEPKKNETEITGPTSAPADLEPMLTPEQVAKLLNVSKATLCRLTKRGEIPYKRIGERVVRYTRSAIEAWMKSENP